ncbi:hypothetical protein HK097_009345 [Rhizophlyctis rosea]|uniref:RNase III domain-containing protein n=1 Tax=Rhizophlyctis rosea TaxID=64517 RepID=A0AAD5SII5_9FUNG|nr:hypothetical protein HK097_009345 [Rhizophlyctis rosea]
MNPSQVIVAVPDSTQPRYHSCWGLVLSIVDCSPALRAGGNGRARATDVSDNPSLSKAVESASSLFGMMGLLMANTLPSPSHIRLAVAQKQGNTWITKLAYDQSSFLIVDADDVRMIPRELYHVTDPSHIEAGSLFEVTRTKRNDHRVLKRYSFRHMAADETYRGDIESNQLDGNMLKNVAIEPEILMALPAALKQRNEVVKLMASHAIRTLLTNNIQIPFSDQLVTWVNTELQRAKNQASTTLLGALGHQVLKALFSISAVSQHRNRLPGFYKNLIHHLLYSTVAIDHLPEKSALYFERIGTNNIQQVIYALFGYIAYRFGMPYVLQIASSKEMIPPIVKPIQTSPPAYNVPNPRQSSVAAIKRSMGRQWHNDKFFYSAFNTGSGDMERAEFIGDAILSYRIGIHAYTRALTLGNVQPTNTDPSGRDKQRQ